MIDIDEEDGGRGRACAGSSGVCGGL